MQGVKSNRESKALSEVAVQLAELGTMGARALARKYLELYGEPTRSNNRDYLIRKLAWKIQERAEGGLSERAANRIAELGDEIPEGWRRRASGERTVVVPVPIMSPSRPTVPRAAVRDARLPPAGATLSRSHGGAMHEVTVREAGVEYGGTTYRSLSEVARVITGTEWNGYAFFGLGARTKGPKAAAKAATVIEHRAQGGVP